MEPTIIPKLESLEQTLQMIEAALKKPEASQHLLSIHRRGDHIIITPVQPSRKSGSLSIGSGNRVWH